MIKIIFRPTFVRQINKLDKDLVEEVHEKIELFKHKENHEMLKVHKLHGRFYGCLSFFVNYKIRIVFEYESTNTAIFLTIGDHDVYK